MRFVLAAAFALTAFAQSQPDPAAFKGMKYRLVGPFRGGRVLAVTGVPGDPLTYYFGGASGGVFKTTDGGVNWKPITDSQPFASTGAIAVAPSDPNVIYVGSGEGCLRGNVSYGNGVYKSTDAGKTWKNIGLADTRQIGGKSWIAITDGIPEGAFVHSVREDPKKKGLLYAGTETGVFVSLDSGSHWRSLQLNLPTVPVHDIVVKDDDLAVATHGRAFWILDDLSPLRQYAPDTVLYQPRPAFHIRFPDQVNKRQPVGENPPIGAIIYHEFAEKPSGEVTLEIIDPQGKLARRYSSVKKAEVRESAEWPDAQHPDETLPVEAGLNRFNWDLYYAGPVQVPGGFYVSDNPPKGPFALPGQYQVKLNVAGKSNAATLQLKPDPRLNTSQADLEKQFALEARIAEKLTTLHTTVNHIRYLRTQLNALDHRLVDSEQFQPIRAAAADLLKKIGAIEDRLMQTKMKSTEGNLAHPSMIDEQLIFLATTLDSMDVAPTAGQNEVFELISQRLSEQLREWDTVLSKDLSALNKLVDQKKLTVVDTQAPPASK
jgi:hypothetical protein